MVSFLISISNKKQKPLFLFLLGGVFILAVFAFCFSSVYSQSATTAFKVIINNNNKYTSSRQVTLTLKAGSDTKTMVLSNTPDFTYSIIGPYQSTKQWTLSDEEGTKTVYAKFCTQDICSPEVVSDSIIYKKPISSVPSVSNDSSSCLDLSFDKNLYLGMSNKDVQCLKIFLNKDPNTILSAAGQGSAGRETTYFGPLTKDAVSRFQNKYKAEISAAAGYTIQATGFVGKGTRAKLNALSEETPAETPAETPVLPVSALSTNLQASINSSNWQDNLTGTAPLTGVDLKADVTGTATGSISYSFDCQGDGTWESPDDTQYKGITSTSKEFTDGCSYLIPGTWTARVKVERGTDSPVYDTVPIIVSQLVIGGCGDGTCNGTETCSTCPGDCPAVCGDGSCCNESETCSTCPGDCGTCSIVCGDDNFVDPSSIIPHPQKIELESCNPVYLDSSWKIYADLSNEYDNFTANYLKNKTLENSTGIINLEINNISGPLSQKRVIIGNPNTNSIIKSLAESKGININDELIKGFNQGYILLIEPNQILILGNSTAGTFYGVVSLSWLLNYQTNQIILPNVKITDWPDLEVRGFYGGSENQLLYDSYSKKYFGPYYSTKEEWVEYLTKFKYNLWTSGPLSEFTKQRHFFLATSLSPESIRSYYNKNLYEGVWAYNIPLKFNSSNYAEPIDDDISLNNSDLEIDNDGDGVPDYWKIINTGYPGRWERDCTQSHSGNCSVKMTLSEKIGIVSSAYFVTKNPYPIAPNRIYILRFWAKKNDADNSDRHPQVTVVMQDETEKDLVIGGNTVYQNRSVDDNSGGWKQYNLVFSTYNNEKFFRIYSRVMDSRPVEVWLDDFQLIDVTKELRNVIKTPSTELGVWNKQRTVKYKEGEDYRLNESGEFNFKNPLEGKKTTIERIEGGRIAPEAEVVADYDFIVNFQQTRDEDVTLSDPLVFNYYENQAGWLKDTMSKTYKPEYIFIGMDEIRGFNRDSRSKKKGLENYQLFAEFLNKIIDMIHSYNPDTKVLIWDDMINPFHNGGQEGYQVNYGGQPGKSWHALDLLKRENVALISWWYSGDSQQKMANSPALYNELGFKFLAGPWYDKENIRFWSYLAQKHNALGMIEHEFYNNVEGVIDAANYSWNTVKINP